MKCIECQTDNTLQDRTTNYGRCKQCGHTFVFEPTAMGTVKVTDGMFAKAIADLSANNTLYFTDKQLFYLLDKRLHGKLTYAAVGLLILNAIILFFTSVVIVVPLVSDGYAWAFLIPGVINLLFIGLIFNLSQQRTQSIKTRQVAARCLQVLGSASFLIATLIAVNTNLFPVFLYGVLVGVWTYFLGRQQYLRQSKAVQEPLIQFNQLQQWLIQWQAVNEIPKLLPDPKGAALPSTFNPEVTAYSFDRVVVTDTAAIAQLLIANNFHFEHNCAILSITGYPQSIFQDVMTMLRRNPDLKVYAIHDCSGKGLNLVPLLRTSPQWFADSDIAVIDVGLMPRQVMTLNNVFIQHQPAWVQAAQQLPDEVRRSLSRAELAWLDAGNGVILESFTPQRLIQVLQRGITLSQPGLDASSDLLLIGDSGSSGYYAVDSFG